MAVVLFIWLTVKMYWTKWYLKKIFSQEVILSYLTLRSTAQNGSNYVTNLNVKKWTVCPKISYCMLSSMIVHYNIYIDITQTRCIVYSVVTIPSQRKNICSISNDMNRKTYIIEFVGYRFQVDRNLIGISIWTKLTAFEFL